jgi:transcription initiation factor TFIID TATA-box-binding protein
MPPKINVENIVATITLDAKIDLKRLVSAVNGIEYNPENFPGAIFRPKELKVAIVIFSSGKANCTGAKNQIDIDRSVEELLKKLQEAGINVRGTPSVQIQNIVASSNMGMEVNLDLLAINCYNTEYEPEQFPGLVFRPDEPKTVILIFRTGKIVIAGAKTLKDLELAAEKAYETIIEHNAIIR